MTAKHRVIVDADACPKNCMAIIQKLVSRYQYEMVTVASFNHHIVNDGHLVVGDEPQATDMAVANLSGAGDIVITQDLGLAGLVLGKGAAVLTPHGRIISTDQILFLLEERDLMARFRRHGGRTKGPAKRTRNDDLLFEKNLMQLLSLKFTEAMEK